MSLTAIVKHGLFVDSACEGELHESFEYQPDEHYDTSFPDGKQVLSMLTIRDIDWDEAAQRFAYLVHYQDKDSVMVWKLIKDMAYIKQLSLTIENKPEDKHWIDLYRSHRSRLERIVHSYVNDPEYDFIDKVFDVSESALYLMGELMLEQTHPITSAHLNPEIDGYTNIDHTPEDQEYVKMPDFITIDGVEVSIKQLMEADGAWSGDLTEYDNLYYDTDLEGELPSASISQMNDSELKVTSDFYRLQYQYTPLMLTINNMVMNDPLVKLANSENKAFAIESAERKLQNSLLIRSLQKALRVEFQNGTPVQDIAAFVMSLPFDLSINGQVATVIDQFGDEILDNIVGPSGLDYQPEVLWEPFIDRFHEQTVNLLAETGNAHSPKLHPKFVTEAFKGVAERQLPIKEVYSQAYDAFREISPAGSTAFRQAIDDEKSPQKAMRKFYESAQQAGEYIPRDLLFRANNNRMLVLTASSGFTKERELNWNLARYKAKAGEIYVSNDTPDESKLKLFNLLLSKGWPHKLIAQLSQ